MSNKDVLEMDGVVIDACRDEFRVQVGESHVVLAKISGKIRLSGIRIVVGDKVKVEISPFDLSRGRITYRHK
jgi:translation initiation factor IF-1